MNKMLNAGICSKSGFILLIAANAIPVENAENMPQMIPNPGINMGKESAVL
tara:strand:+ start:657 stop:809 length:153 start_codon:yes stop_codon:yes gene_type:complete